MNSSKKRKSFTIEDFEKGLMLAGLVSPSSLAELNERTELEAYEKELAAEKSRTYFKRAVLAAAIADQLHLEPTFGHVKFQKLVYLCEHAAGMQLEHKYSKQAAGPFDKKFMHTIDAEFKKQKWFKVERRTNQGITRFVYERLEKCEQYKTYYSSYFGQNDERIQAIINIFRRQKTDDVEIAATIYACLRELKAENVEATSMSLIEKFYAWSKEKKRFEEQRILQCWNWMIAQQLVPR